MSNLYVNEKSYNISKGQSILDVIKSNNINIENTCIGKGTCGKCKVKIVSGDVSEITDEEIKFLSDNEISEGIRLGCLAFPYGDTYIELLEQDNNNHKILMDGYIPDFKKKPLLTKEVNNIKKATLDDTTSYEDVIKEAIGVSIKDNYDILKGLSNLYKEEKITSVYIDDQLIGLEPTDATNKNYAVAIDIGTTTVVVSLIDINTQTEIAQESEINPQKKYGLDILSRINILRTEKNGLSLLHKEIVVCINGLIEKVCKKKNILKEFIYEVLVSANTTMMHFLINISPESIGKSPYTPVFTNSKSVDAKAIGVNISPFGKVYLLPGVSGFIGADVVSGVCVCNLDKLQKNVLFIDIGTNGEIVLSKSGKLSSCSCAAGPALEGMNISCGMRAANGAIEKIKINRDIEIGVIGNENPTGICGSGIIDIVSELARLKLIGKTGRISKRSSIKEDEKLGHLANCIVDENKKRRFVLIQGKKEISITQEDIRQVQLAKGAILSGIYLLLKKNNMDLNDLDEVIIAGQFGKHLSIESIIGVGIVPKGLKDKVRYVGNSSKSGAIMALLSKEIRENMDVIANKIDYTELSTEKEYEKLFIECLKF